MNDSEFLVVVDIQPGYQSGCHHIMPDIIEKLNNTEQRIIFFYVGKELDLDHKYDVIGYLLEHGLEESKIDEIRFIEKEYGYFRSWMDKGVDEEIILNAVKLMHETKVYDSRDFSEQHWQSVLNGKEPGYFIYEDNVYYPHFNSKLLLQPEVDNIELIGGGRYECLEEINLYLKALGKKTFVTEQLCYGADGYIPDHVLVKKKRLKVR